MTAPLTMAFDVYGTLVDPIGISVDLEVYLGPDAAHQVAEVWRRKQLEITFRLAAMRTYQDFEWCTRRSLDYALASSDAHLSDVAKDALIERYSHLEIYPDVIPGLTALGRAGVHISVLSNGTPRMLAELMDNTGLSDHIFDVVSVDEIRTFKPDPAVYLHAARKVGRAPHDVMLVSSNPFDVIGAEHAGLQAAWVNRNNVVFDSDGEVPDVVVRSLLALPLAGSPK